MTCTGRQQALHLPSGPVHQIPLKPKDAVGKFAVWSQLQDERPCPAANQGDAPGGQVEEGEAHAGGDGGLQLGMHASSQDLTSQLLLPPIILPAAWWERSWAAGHSTQYHI